MSASKRPTPRCKGPPSVSKYQTPKNLNSTVSSMGRSGTGSRLMMSGVKPLKSDSSSNVTIGFPSMKSNLLFAEPTFNKELELDFAYNDYLQAHLKRDIVVNCIQRQEQNVKDQLWVQKDNLYETKVKLHETEEGLAKINVLQQVDEVLKDSFAGVDSFKDICNNSDLKTFLNQLTELLDLLSKKIYVKGVKAFKDKDSYEQLAILMNKCVLLCQESKPSNWEEISNVAVLVKSLQGNIGAISEKQNMLNDIHKIETSKLMKSLSHFYAVREKYS